MSTPSQSTHDAALSCSEHVAIVAALERHDAGGAAELMRAHIGAVAAALGARAPPADPLRQALQAPATPSATRAPNRRPKET